MTSDVRTVVVCMVDSVHTARWLANYRDQGINFHLFPSTPNRRVHPLIRELVENKDPNSSTYTLNPVVRWLAIPMWCVDLLVGNHLRGFVVSKMVRKLEATYIHAMELNNAGKIVAKSLAKLDALSLKVIATVWGSDIFWFGRFSKNQKDLADILQKTNLLISECSRDLDLANNLGFKGEFKKSESLFGFTDYVIKKDRTKASERNIILIKGYESFAGRASIALKAVQILSNKLEKFEIHVYSTTWKSRRLIRSHNKGNDRKIVYYKKSSLSSEQMLALFERARIHIGVSLSDGVPASMLESIVTGAFPIQSNTACYQDWLIHEKTGLLVSPELDEVVLALSTAIQDDQLVDSAMLLNRELAIERLSQMFVSKRISQLDVYS